MDTPISRLAAHIRQAVDQGTSYEKIAARAKIDDWQNVQNIANGTVTTQSKYFIPICVALGLDPVNIWYGDEARPIDPDTAAIIDEILTWPKNRRIAHREALGIPPPRSRQAATKAAI